MGASRRYAKYAKWNKAEIDKSCIISLICGIEETKQASKQNKTEKQTHRYRKQICGCQKADGWGGQQNRWRGLKGTNLQPYKK